MSFLVEIGGHIIQVLAVASSAYTYLRALTETKVL